LADLASEWFGTPVFLILNFLFWAVWILDGWKIDEFTLLVSLQAILMSILILNAANRQQRKEKEIAQQDRRRDEEVQYKVEDIHEDVERIKELLGDDETEDNHYTNHHDLDSAENIIESLKQENKELSDRLSQYEYE
jgi:uncharacterized membrane protein